MSTVIGEFIKLSATELKAAGELLADRTMSTIKKALADPDYTPSRENAAEIAALSALINNADRERLEVENSINNTYTTEDGLTIDISISFRREGQDD